MVDKKAFNSALAKLVRGDVNIIFAAIVDREGITISYVAKSRKYPVTPQQVGSIIKAVSFPSNDVVKIFNLGDLVSQFFVLKDACLFQINLGHGFLVVLDKIIGFPLNKNKTLSALEKLKPLLNQLKPEKSAMLKELDENVDVAEFRELTDTQVQKISDFIDNLDANSLETQPVPVTTSEMAPALTEIFSAISSPWVQNAVAHNFDGEIITELGTSMPEFAQAMGVLFKVCSDQLKTLDYGDFVFSCAAYGNGDAAFTFPVGKDGEVPVILSGYVTQNYSLKDMMKIPVTVALSLKDSAGSDLSLIALDMINFLTFPVTELKAIVQDLLRDERLDEARKYMQRAVEIQLRVGDYTGAGDFLRWVGFAYFKEDDVENAKSYYLEAAKNHEFGQAFDKTGDDYKDLANLSLRAGDSANAFEYFTQASFYYSKSGTQEEFDKIEEERSKLLKQFSTQIKEILDNSTSEVIKLDYIASKVELREERIADILRDLISEGEIPGMVDEGKGRYLKNELAPAKAPEKLEKIELLKQQMRESALGQKATPTTELQNQIATQESELEKWERSFQQINLPFARYLEYQETLDKKQFLEQKLKVLNVSQPFTAQDGQAIRCTICLNEIQSHQPICRCSQNHPAHLNCMAVWVQKQSSCPVCETRLLPSVLKTIMPNEMEDQQQLEARDAIIDDLRQQLKTAEGDLADKNQLIQDCVQPGTKEEDLFKKLVIERDERAKLETSVTQKDKTIQELKGMLKAFKK